MNMYRTKTSLNFIWCIPNIIIFTLVTGRKMPFHSSLDDNIISKTSMSSGSLFFCGCGFKRLIRMVFGSGLIQIKFSGGTEKVLIFQEKFPMQESIFS